MSAHMSKHMSIHLSVVTDLEPDGETAAAMWYSTADDMSAGKTYLEITVGNRKCVQSCK